MTIRVTGWRTSSYSGSQGGNCVEVAGQDRRVLVRDTKQAGASLDHLSAQWALGSGSRINHVT